MPNLGIAIQEDRKKNPNFLSFETNVYDRILSPVKFENESLCFLQRELAKREREIDEVKVSLF